MCFFLLVGYFFVWCEVFVVEFFFLYCVIDVCLGDLLFYVVVL